MANTYRISQTLTDGYTGHVFNLSRIYKQNIQATVQRINSKSTSHVANLSYIHNIKSDKTTELYKLQMYESRDSSILHIKHQIKHKSLDSNLVSRVTWLNYLKYT